MEIKLMTPQEYSLAFDWGVPHVYNSTAFNELNRHKALAVYYVAFCDPEPLLGIIVGEVGCCLLSPFSAPFGGFSKIGNVSAETVNDAVRLLSEFGKERKLLVEITLPPAIYAPRFVALQAKALAEYGELVWNDLNYHRVLDFPQGHASDGFGRKARAAWRSAVRRGFEFHMLDASDYDSARRVYDVVCANHHALGYPVKMTLDEVVRTAPLTGSFFMVMSLGSRDVAAAMINRVADTVCQFVYWGDLLEYRSLHPMTLLAALSFGACRDMGFEIADLGPSSEFGVPSPGLCHFKESIGCISVPKPRFRL